jgi:hypothetical protein
MLMTMKRTSIFSLALAALAACSSSPTNNGTTTTSGSGGTSGGSATTSQGSGGSSGGSTGGAPACAAGVCVTLTSVGVQPAALAALTALGLTPPDLTSGYHVSLQAVALMGTSPKITGLGDIELTSANQNGPITFTNIFADAGAGVAELGLISAITADSLPDGGTPPIPAAPTCAQITAGAGGTAPGGFTDWYIPAGAQVYFGDVTPTHASITNGVAFGLPASYVAVLDCAAGLVPGGADFLTQGFALLYASQDAAGAGNPLANVTFTNTQVTFFYFPAGYAAGSATATPPTSGNGIAVLTGASSLATVNAADTAGDKFNSRDLSSPANEAYQVVFAPGT